MKVLNSSITINQINYLIALHETGSFSAAADMCLVTQSTLSTMIKKLEDQINMPIFDRKTKPIQLTHVGEALISQFTVIHNEFENLLDLIQEENEEFFGTLKIGIIPTLAPFLLPLILPKILTQYPKVDFRIHEITTGEIIHRIKLRSLDVGVLSLPIKDDALTQKSLFKEDFLVYDTRGKSNKKAKYEIKDIDVSRLWLLEESHCLTSQIGKICHLKQKQNVNTNLKFNSGSILSLLEIVHINQGITLLPMLATLNKNIINESFIYPIKNPIPARDIGFVTYKSFIKKRLLTILENEIKLAIAPFNTEKSKQKIIAPFY